MKKKPTKSDLKRLDEMSDANIDYSDIPALDTAFFRDARVVVPPGKKQLTVRLDADVLAWPAPWCSASTLTPRRWPRCNWRP